MAATPLIDGQVQKSFLLNLVLDFLPSVIISHNSRKHFKLVDFFFTAMSVILKTELLKKLNVAVGS